MNVNSNESEPTEAKGKGKNGDNGKSRSRMPCLKSGGKLQEEKTVFDHTEFLVSPILRSTILFWACYLPEEVLTWKEIREIIQELDAYPEGRNTMDNGKTALHAASIAGNWKKLRVLLADIDRRYRNGKHSKGAASGNASQHLPIQEKNKVVVASSASLPASERMDVDKILLDDEQAARFIKLCKDRLGLKEYAEQYKEYKKHQEKLKRDAADAEKRREEREKSDREKQK